MASEPRNMSLVVMKNGPIQTIDDLKGKRVGVTTAGSLTDWLTRRLSESKGWGPAGIDVTAMGEMLAARQRLGTGKIVVPTPAQSQPSSAAVRVRPLTACLVAV